MPTLRGRPDLWSRLRWNAASGVLRFTMLGLVYFFTYPYMFEKLGAERFGMWSLALIVSQSLTASDLGISGALMRFVPEQLSVGNTARMSELANTGLFLLAGLGGGLALGTVALSSWVVRALRIPAPLQEEMRLLVVGMAAVFVLNLMALGLSAVLNGLQRMDASNLVYTGAALFGAAGTVVVLRLGWGLAGLVLNAAFMGLLWAGGSFLLLRRLLPGFRLGLSSVRRSDAAALLRYGLPIQIAGAGGLATIPAMKVLLSRYVSLSSVSFFELASGITLQLRSCFLMIAMPLTSASAQLNAEGRGVSLAELYRRSLRYLFLAALPVFALGVIFAPGFTTFWLRGSKPFVATTLSLLAVGWFLNTLSLPAYFLLQGQGFARYQAYFATLQVAASVLLGYFLVLGWGYYGAVVGMVAGLSIAALYLMWQYRRLFPPVSVTLWDSSLVLALVLNGAMLAIFFFLRPEWRHVSSFPVLVMLGATFLLLYLSLLYVTGAFPEAEG